jgi:hypothetical protein
VDPVAGTAKAAQALRPGGRLAVFWNVFQPPPDVGEAFAAVCRQVMPDSPGNFWASSILDAYSAGFTRAADGIREAAALRPRLAVRSLGQVWAQRRRSGRAARKFAGHDH